MSESEPISHEIVNVDNDFSNADHGFLQISEVYSLNNDQQSSQEESTPGRVQTMKEENTNAINCTALVSNNVIKQTVSSPTHLNPQVDKVTKIILDVEKNGPIEPSKTVHDILLNPSNVEIKKELKENDLHTEDDLSNLKYLIGDLRDSDVYVDVSKMETDTEENVQTIKGMYLLISITLQHILCVYSKLADMS